MYRSSIVAQTKPCLYFVKLCLFSMYVVNFTCVSTIPVGIVRAGRGFAVQ